MFKKAAVIFGLVLVVIGLLGYSSAAAPDGMLFGLFAVNSIQNSFHIGTGTLTLLAGWTGSHAARLSFQLCTILYGLFAIHGFFAKAGFATATANNLADAWLHTVIAAVALYFGFFRPFMKPKPREEKIS